MLINLTNSTGSSVTRIARVRTNLGSDSSSKLVYDNTHGSTIGSYWLASANTPTSFGNGVLWTITTDASVNASSPGSDPVNSIVYREDSA